VTGVRNRWYSSITSFGTLGRSIHRGRCHNSMPTSAGCRDAELRKICRLGRTTLENRHCPVLLKGRSSSSNPFGIDRQSVSLSPLASASSRKVLQTTLAYSSSLAWSNFASRQSFSSDGEAKYSVCSISSARRGGGTVLVAVYGTHGVTLATNRIQIVHYPLLRSAGFEGGCSICTGTSVAWRWPAARAISSPRRC